MRGGGTQKPAVSGTQSPSSRSLSFPLSRVQLGKIPGIYLAMYQKSEETRDVSIYVLSNKVFVTARAMYILIGRAMSPQALMLPG